MSDPTLHHICDEDYFKNTSHKRLDSRKNKTKNLNLGLYMSQGIHSHWNKVHVHLHPLLLLTPFSLHLLLIHKSAHTHYQVNISTYHSSQLTPIYPRAFKQRSENRGSDIASRQHHRLVRIKVLPWVGGKRLQTPHNAVQPNEIMQIKF